ncbi:TnsA endonuclease N-terminal domain-containing protein [Clostridium cibarium]|uniref:TnsA endonuclease N-terminal domain-containing protein n=1 Tax=Clostridium cibarium TaxID=2762247 RepID=A0ABR8PUY9_9CLOT|nr:TnsA endonuclease N-terminal domain-containing protein [Clostridium cibarium]MBD7911972.1 TnsA endonuclease N-terminal domain-containing protein [Clostridium cibarium]
MAKRKRGFTREKYDKWIKEKRGLGKGKDYKVWLTVQDVPSLGKTSRLLGIKTGREHQFFSNNETSYFFILEFYELITDIREQFPLLPIEETIAIAQELGIKHPTDPNTKEEIVITTDFLIDINEDNYKKTLARTIKQKEDLDKRQLDKFEIERRYWNKRNIDWGIVTENEINKVLARNIEIVYQFYDLENLKGFENFNTVQIRELTNAFKKQISGTSVIREEASLFEDNMLLEGGCGIAMFKHLIITKQIIVDMLTPINVDKSIFVKLSEVRL